MTPAQKRLLTPLRAPRWPRAPWPLNIIAAAVDGYYEAFFMVLAPAARGPVSLADEVLVPPGRK